MWNISLLYATSGTNFYTKRCWSLELNLSYFIVFFLICNFKIGQCKKKYVQNVGDKMMYLITHLRNSCQDILRVCTYIFLHTCLDPIQKSKKKIVNFIHFIHFRIITSMVNITPPSCRQSYAMNARLFQWNALVRCTRHQSVHNVAIIEVSLTTTSCYVVYANRRMKRPSLTINLHHLTMQQCQPRQILNSLFLFT